MWRMERVTHHGKWHGTCVGTRRIDVCQEGNIPRLGLTDKDISLLSEDECDIWHMA
jgi:hypothetical protein